MGENVYKYNIRLSDLIRLICVSSLPWDYTMLRAYQVWLIRKWVEELTLRLSWRQSFPWCWRLLLRLFWDNSLNIELTLTLSWRSDHLEAESLQAYPQAEFEVQIDSSLENDQEVPTAVQVHGLALSYFCTKRWNAGLWSVDPQSICRSWSRKKNIWGKAENMQGN